MSDDVLDALADRAFAALEAAGGDPRRLHEPLRTVAVVHAAQGVVDDGGLRYLFENDWAGRPPYALFADAYRAVGAVAHADAIERGAALFPFAHPERDADRRREHLAGEIGLGLDALDADLDEDVWGLLGAFARRAEPASS